MATEKEIKAKRDEIHAKTFEIKEIQQRINDAREDVVKSKKIKPLREAKDKAIKDLKAAKQASRKAIEAFNESVANEVRSGAADDFALMETKLYERRTLMKEMHQLRSS